jgi:hypothetical protein
LSAIVPPGNNTAWSGKSGISADWIFIDVIELRTELVTPCRKDFIAANAQLDAIQAKSR